MRCTIYDRDMPKTVFHTATTINGFLATDDDSLQWLFDVPTAGLEHGDLTQFMPGVGAIVMGSTTYNWVVDFENLMEHPEKWQPFYGDRPTWVFTSREQRQVPGANLHFTSGDVSEAWPRLSPPRTAATSGSWAAVIWSASSSTPGCSTRFGGNWLSRGCRRPGLHFGAWEKASAKTRCFGCA